MPWALRSGSIIPWKVEWNGDMNSAGIQNLQSELVESATRQANRPSFDGIGVAMERVEDLLQQELRSQSCYVDQLLTFVASLGGKRMRPALVLLSGQATNATREDVQVSPEHITVATVIEMIHIATLVHDDILDGADTRRHQPTVNSRWGNQGSVLLGDYLFTHAFYLASTLPTTYGCRIIGEATNKVCVGEMQQVGHRGNLLLTEAEYFAIIRGKTAALTACATQLGAHYSHADSSVVERMTRYGHDLGMAFQIVDDLLDLVGNEVEVGKSLGTDLDNQKLTLPLIHLRDNAGADRDRVLDLLGRPMTSASRETLVALMREHGAIEYAKRVAVDFSRSAQTQLDGLPKSSARQTLQTLCDFVIARTH